MGTMHGNDANVLGRRSRMGDVWIRMVAYAHAAIEVLLSPPFPLFNEVLDTQTVQPMAIGTHVRPA